MISVKKHFMKTYFLVCFLMATACLGSWNTAGIFGTGFLGIGLIGVTASHVADSLELGNERQRGLARIVSSVALACAAGAFALVSYQTSNERRDWTDLYLAPVMLVGTVAYVGLTIYNASRARSQIRVPV